MDSMIWPGFVDAMTALLLILMFVMSIFMIIQFTMSQKISGQSKELDDLTRQLSGLANVLSLERDRSTALEGEVGVLQSNLASQSSETDRLNAAMAALVRSRDTAVARAVVLDSSLAESMSERELLAAALASTRSEMDAAVETARLAAARREAMAALIAGLEARDEGREAELATISAERAGALALIEQLRAAAVGREVTLSGRERELAALAARRSEALALIAELEAERNALRADQAERDSLLGARERELAQLDAERTAALALIVRLEADKDALAAVKAALEAQTAALGTENLSLEDRRKEVEALRAVALERLAELEIRLTAEEEARLLEATAAETLRNRLADLEANLTVEEEARLLDAAAAAVLKRRLEDSGTELDAMTLALEGARKEAEDTLTLLAAAEVARQALEGRLSDGGAAIDREAALRRLAESQLAEVRAQTLEEQRRVALLSAQTRELSEQLGGLAALLDDSEARDAESEIQIAKLGERLNRALARKVGQLARFRSVFFEKMEQVLGGRQDIQRVGDRFVFQSEVLFAPGSANLGPAGRAELAKLGAVLREIEGEIPDDLKWIVRIDGHTDKIPVGGGGRYRDNWELSQGRALSVVTYLVERENVLPHRLAATGFGEFQPIDDGDTPEALARNRRIEFKFTER
ncbi:MAG: peptidoglycan -binding protein [Proteobacteria bacterium]|nr:peptidoglycan -binding protein [Pseudomonadota bacterium]MCH8951208.1 peptidoglycan -binding protein [Pseudomonadota bacterium]